MASVIQTGTNAGSGDLTIALGVNVTLGNLLLAFITQTSAAVRGYVVFDSLGNTWVQVLRVDHGGSRWTEIWYAKITVAGACTLTSDQDTGAVTQQFSGLEVSGTDATTPLGASGSFVEAANASSHFCAAAGSIDTVGAGGILLAGGMLSASGTSTTEKSGTSTTEKSGWTALQKGAQFLHQYRLFNGGALSDERAEYTSVTARQGAHAIAEFQDAAGGGGGGILYPQLERSVRGLNRGLCTGKV